MPDKEVTEMAILERHVGKVLGNRWDEVLTLEKRWDALEARLGGFPPKRRYRMAYGGLGWSTWVWESQWESVEEMSVAYKRLDADPECAALEQPWEGLVENIANELYEVLP
jgi:hypothetical protein